MLDSVPVPLRAIFWPLLGAVLILGMSRLLPNWVRRLMALAAAVASLVALWSLRTAGVERVDILWEPLNFFRMSPTLYPDSLSLLVGLTLAGVTAAAVLGVQGSEPKKTIWHGLLLAALAGCLVMAMATNLLTLAMGSALLDLALIAMVVSAPGNADRTAWRMAVPGIASTFVLVLCALQMDTQVGTASLLAQRIPARIVVLLGLAGLLRLMIYPLHPRGLHTPENAASLLLPAGAAIYLLARSQGIAPLLNEQPWMLLAGSAALVAGGLLAWTGSISSTARLKPSTPLRAGVRPAQHATQTKDPPTHRLARTWSGLAVHQAGYALVFVLLVGARVPWPLISLTLALGMIAIWWDATLERLAAPTSGFLERLGAWRTRARASAVERFPALGRWRESWLGRYGATFLPALALASLAGAPLTVGAMGRWPFYATLLHQEQASLLIAVLVADTFLAAGLWTLLSVILKQAGERRLSLVAIVAMIALAIPLIALGIAPGSLDLSPVEIPEVSGWGIGLISVLPWLVGAWLARVGARLGGYLGPVRRIVDLDWAYRTGSWAGQRLAGAIYWVGRVGEGEGWFGWVLIILALGAVLLIAR